MDIDLTKCKVGQKLRIRLEGEIGEEMQGKITNIVTFMGESTGTPSFPYAIKYSDGSYGTCTVDGYVYNKNRRVDDMDILEVL